MSNKLVTCPKCGASCGVVPSAFDPECGLFICWCCGTKGQIKIEKPEPAKGETVNNEFLIQFFKFDHLPAHLQEVSRPFSELAEKILSLPRNQERTVALRKLLEAKDCAVRAQLAGSHP